MRASFLGTARDFRFGVRARWQHWEVGNVRKQMAAGRDVRCFWRQNGCGTLDSEGRRLFKRGRGPAPHCLPPHTQRSASVYRKRRNSGSGRQQRGCPALHQFDRWDDSSISTKKRLKYPFRTNKTHLQPPIYALHTTLHTLKAICHRKHITVYF